LVGLRLVLCHSAAISNSRLLDWLEQVQILVGPHHVLGVDRPGVQGHLVGVPCRITLLQRRALDGPVGLGLNCFIHYIK